VANPLSLRAYLALTHLLPLVARLILRRRLKRGKEDARRWREKLGQASSVRPSGKLIWINAVGLGEVLSLRGLIAEILQADNSVSILVTSTTRDSALVFGQNLPERTQHQFLPIDAPGYRCAFLGHWKPDVAIWAEQDLWPGFVAELAQRGVPQAVVASRMNAKSFEKKQRFKGLYRSLYQKMKFITAQDEGSAKHLGKLGVENAQVTGSLKPSAPPLAFDTAALEQAKGAIGERFVWSVVSSYPEDEAIAIAAHKDLCLHKPNALLIVAPRQIKRNFEHFQTAPRWSKGETPKMGDGIWLADTIGDLGLILRLSQAALIGGTFNQIQGHNPWEAAILGVPVLHGPRTENFATDYDALKDVDATFPVSGADAVVKALTSPNLASKGRNAKDLATKSRNSLRTLAAQILAMDKTT